MQNLFYRGFGDERLPIKCEPRVPSELATRSEPQPHARATPDASWLARPRPQSHIPMLETRFLYQLLTIIIKIFMTNNSLSICSSLSSSFARFCRWYFRSIFFTIRR